MWTKGTEEQALENVNPTCGEGNGNLLQYSCLENPMDQGAWQATVHRVARVSHNLVTKERERENPTWSKGDKWRHWTGWAGGCFSPTKVIFPPIPNILFSDSKFTRQNAGMALILCPSGRGCPSIQTQVSESGQACPPLKVKKKKMHPGFPEVSCGFHLGELGLESLVLSGNTDKTSFMHQDTDYNVRIQPRNYLKAQPASAFLRSIFSYQQSWPFAPCICCPM